jgi:hypothetical protein
MRVFIAIIGLFVLCGCHSQKTPSEPFGDMWRPDDSRFTTREREIVAAARRFVEKEAGKPVDGYYKIEATKEGYDVLVEIAAGYEHGRPLFVPGGNPIVELHKDLSLARYMPGE